MEFFVTIKGIPVHIHDSEKGEKVILLLHGYLETLYIWDHFASLLEKEFRIIRFDLPGQGLTGSRDDSNSMPFQAEIAKGVLDYFNISSAILIGHSMGGYIGQAFLKLFPERISALVHFNSNPYADPIEKVKDREKEISFIEQGKLLTLAQIAIPNMYSQDNLRQVDSIILETLEICETHEPKGFIATIRGLMSREDNTALLASSDKLIVFFYGDNDKLLSGERREKIMADIPNAVHFLIPGTGHNSFLEKPNEVLEKLLSVI